MGKVSTTNAKEALRTGKEYLGSVFQTEVKKIKVKKIHRCKYCKDVLKSDDYDRYKFYCSIWCREQYVLDNRKLRKCELCDESVKYWTDKKGFISTYSKFCEKHSNKLSRKNSRKIKLIK